MLRLSSQLALRLSPASAKIFGHMKKLSSATSVTIYQQLKEDRETRNGRAPVHDDQFDVGVLAVFVQEVGHEVGDGLVRDVTTQHDVPAYRRQQRAQ